MRNRPSIVTDQQGLLGKIINQGELPQVRTLVEFDRSSFLFVIIALFIAIAVLILLYRMTKLIPA